MLKESEVVWSNKDSGMCLVWPKRYIQYLFYVQMLAFFLVNLDRWSHVDQSTLKRMKGGMAR